MKKPIKQNQMYTNKLIEDFEVNVNETDYIVDLTAVAKLVDGSFSHGFGVESQQSIEMESIDIETVYDTEGDIVTDTETINSIARNIDQEDFLHKFDSEDFEV